MIDEKGGHGVKHFEGPTYLAAHQIDAVDVGVNHQAIEVWTRKVLSLRDIDPIFFTRVEGIAIPSFNFSRSLARIRVEHIAGGRLQAVIFRIAFACRAELPKM